MLAAMIAKRWCKVRLMSWMLLYPHSCIVLFEQMAFTASALHIILVIRGSKRAGRYASTSSIILNVTYNSSMFLCQRAVWVCCFNNLVEFGSLKKIAYRILHDPFVSTSHKSKYPVKLT